MRIYLSSLGQDSHRFCSSDSAKDLWLGGVLIPHERGLEGNSDADVLLHALCNALSNLSGTPILGARADELCSQGLTASAVYVQEALRSLAASPGAYLIHHVCFAVEAARPKLLPYHRQICQRVAEILQIKPEFVCLTATTGEGLTAAGRGEGIAAFCQVSASRLP